MRYVLTVISFLLPMITLSQEFHQTGKASYYADKFEGRKTASGEIFSNKKLSAAHRTLPFGTRVLVTNLSNNKSLTVVINDRGPFIKGRIIDLSQRAASELGFLNDGITSVRITIVREFAPRDSLLQPLPSLPAEIILENKEIKALLH